MSLDQSKIKRLVGKYRLTEKSVNKSDYETVESSENYTYLEFEIKDSVDNSVLIAYSIFALNVEKGERTGRVVKLGTDSNLSFQIFINEPVSLKKSQHDTEKIPIDWFYFDGKNKTVNYIADPSKEIIRARKKLKNS